MNMKDVKAISIPVNGVDTAVKKIVNSNGDIIWGSQAAFPYRRLEYIQGDGTNYIETNTNVNRNATYQFELGFTTTTGNQLSGCELSTAGSNNARFKFGISGSGYLYMGYATNLASSTTPESGKFYTYYAKAGEQWIKDGSTTLVSATSTLPTSGLGTGNITIFALRSSGNITQVANSVGTRIKSYIVTSGTNVYTFVPAQRKSDGKLGLYNVYNNIFYPEVGNGALVAGPTVDEYWDLTAPA